MKLKNLFLAVIAGVALVSCAKQLCSTKHTNIVGLLEINHELVYIVGRGNGASQHILYREDDIKAPINVRYRVIGTKT